MPATVWDFGTLLQLVILVKILDLIDTQGRRVGSVRGWWSFWRHALHELLNLWKNNNFIIKQSGILQIKNNIFTMNLVDTTYQDDLFFWLLSFYFREKCLNNKI